jgi:hypothetical protein
MERPRSSKSGRRLLRGSGESHLMEIGFKATGQCPEPANQSNNNRLSQNIWLAMDDEVSWMMK